MVPCPMRPTSSPAHGAHMNELELIEWVRERSRAHSSLLIGIGDDMAVVAANQGVFLVATDLLLDSVHFDSHVHTAHQIGRKAAARALSDCAAMAVRPVTILVSLVLPRGETHIDPAELMGSLMQTSRQFGAEVAGGDTARWSGPLAIDVVVTAEPYPGISPVLRSGARAGDRLWTTGPLGGSILGHHLEFTPRIEESRTIAERLGPGLHAMLDISDGLTLDLGRMCRASGVGAQLDEIMLDDVVTDDARSCADRDGVSPLDHALSDGEDYELLLAVAPDSNVDGLGLYPLGSIVADGLAFKDRHGQVKCIEPRGYVH